MKAKSNQIKQDAVGAYILASIWEYEDIEEREGGLQFCVCARGL